MRVTRRRRDRIGPASRVAALIAALAAAATSAWAAAGGAEPPPLAAGRLPLRAFTSADGLVSETGLLSVTQGSRGYLWVSTLGGLSRFDGREFVNALAGETIVSRIVEGGDGTIWIATARGLLRLDSGATADFEASLVTASPEPAATVLEDEDGTLWTCHRDRLTRHARRADGSLDSRGETIALPHARNALRECRRLALAPDGSIWIATNWGAVRRLPGGEMAAWPLGVDPEDSDRVFALTIDREARVWIGHGRHLVVVRPPDASSPDARRDVQGLLSRALATTPAGPAMDLPLEPGEARVVDERHGLRGSLFFGDLHESADGTIWIGTTEGLGRVIGDRLEFFGAEQGIDGHVGAVCEDRSGNVWFGLGHRGLHRVAARGFETFDRRHGAAASEVRSVLALDGAPAILMPRTSKDARRGELVLQRLSASGFDPPELRFERPLGNVGWGWGQVAAHDGARGLWIATGEGLVEFARGRPDGGARWVERRRLGVRDGLGGPEVFRVFLDSGGRLWVATFPTTHALTVVDARTGAARALGPAEGFPGATPTAFAEAPDGTVWAGLYPGGLARCAASRCESWGQADGIPAGLVGDLLVDGPEAVYAATDGSGLLRIEIVGDAPPRIRQWDVRSGLSSNRVHAVAPAAGGALLLGTDRGVDLFDPRSGRVDSFTTADGLAGNDVRTIRVLADGSAWFGTAYGLSRFRDRRTRSPTDPQMVIGEVELDGARVPVPVLGTPRVAGLVTRPGRARLRVDYAAIDLEPGERLRFRHRLVGLDDAWSTPSERSLAEFASLPPGRYRFEASALRGGVEPAGPVAVVELRVPRPFWQRAWFVALAAGLVAAVALLAHRARVSRLLALERQRTRIAMDLHDEVGSGLGSIGLLADLAARDDIDAAERDRLTGEIGDAASELGTALDDIVGTLRPGGETIEAFARQLVARARRIAAGPEPAFVAELPDAWPATRLTLPVRSSVFRIALEAVHNAVRHSGARTVRLSLARASRRWVLTVEDDGRGFPDGAAAGDAPEADGRGGRRGLGLESMRRRADSIGAELRIASVPGGGTAIEVTFDPRAGVR